MSTKEAAAQQRLVPFEKVDVQAELMPELAVLKTLATLALMGAENEPACTHPDFLGEFALTMLFVTDSIEAKCHKMWIEQGGEPMPSIARKRNKRRTK